ncbi:MAG: C26 family cysteine hydrolase domain-containing family [Planctomycetaceae bacterium]|nr:C26 family cysteine hydrolase domain-containing family [Planctomycetaceae bacterium]
MRASRCLPPTLLLLFLTATAPVAAEVDPWRAVFNRPEELASSDAPLVCVLNIQHPDVIRGQLAKQAPDLYSGERFRSRVEALAGLPCLHLHFTEVTGADLDRPNVKAILISGRSKTVPGRDSEFFSLIRNTKIPMIGFCGGMQLIGKAYSAEVSQIRQLREGEADPNPNYHPGLFKEWGFLPVRITTDRDPLFDSLPDEIIVREAHAFHVPTAPAEFEVLAATDECPVEAFKHRDRLLYGTQFHPEAYDDEHPQGQVILQNFLRLAGAASAPADAR